MNNQLSEKLRIASFIATLLVVLRHSSNYSTFFPNEGMPSWAYDTEWGTLFWTDVAVPFFFFASGLFFMRYSYYNVKGYVCMLKKKSRSLLLPFLIWNAVGCVALFFYDPFGSLGNTVLSCLQNLLMSQWYGPLWYVRDIMLLMLIYPLYGWMYRKWGQIVLVLFIVYWMMTRWNPGWCDLLTGEGVIFFLLGGLAQQYQDILTKRSPKWLSVLVLFVWVAMSFTYTSWDSVAHRVSLLIALPAFWMSLDLITGTVKEWCLRLAPYSFLIYVTHFYLQKAIKMGVAILFPENVFAALVAFFIVPAITVLIIISMGKLWKKYHAKSYAVCMGGRG